MRDRHLSQLDQTMKVVEKEDTGTSDRAREEELASLYEFLVLHKRPVPSAIEQTMLAAHRRVHLRGLDPLRRIG
jgi:hypothetical protein